MSDIAIRAAETSDAEAIHEIMGCPRVIANSMQLPWRTLEWHRWWLGRRRPEDHLLVAIIDERVIANLGLETVEAARRSHPASMRTSVHDDFHNRGGGHALMAEAAQGPGTELRLPSR